MDLSGKIVPVQRRPWELSLVAFKVSIFRC